MDNNQQKKEWTIDIYICNNVEECQNNYAKWKKTEESRYYMIPLI